MSGFAKLDSGIVQSTIWVQPHDVLRTWIALLAMANQDGVVHTAAPALAHLCMIPLDRMREILRILESPDEDSRSDAEGGRRLVKIEGGWWLVNYAEYRRKVSAEEKREADRVRIAAKRGARRVESRVVAECRAASQTSEAVAEVAQAEAEAENNESKEQKHVQPLAAPSRFREFWVAYPNKKGKQEAERAWHKRKLDERCDELIAHVRLMIATDDSWNRGFIPMGSTYLNQARWEDVPSGPTTCNGRPSVVDQIAANIERARRERAERKLQGVIEGECWRSEGMCLPAMGEAS